MSEQPAPTPADIAEAVLNGEEVALPEDPAVRAHALRLTGASWAAVAAETDYPSGRAAALAVSAMLQRAALEQSAEARQGALALELDRLDALLLAYWDRAIGGDLKAAKYLLDLSKHRAVLERWDQRDKIVDNRTIIITGDDMAEQLRRMAGGAEPPALAG
jgi:hypothetical protein